METFELKLAQAASDRTILGAIGAAWNNKGETLYHHAAGSQSLEANSPPLDPDSVFCLGSAGKFMTHIAALQLVEKGSITLDEPLEKHLPELGKLPLITQYPRSSDDEKMDFTLRPPEIKITLRHLLLHTSGISSPEHPLIEEFSSSSGENAAAIKNLGNDFFASIPLVFEPGSGFEYGWSIHWTQRVVSKLSGAKGGFVAYIQENVFRPLGMESSTYFPRDNQEVWERRLRMVQRDEKEGFVSADDETQGLVCSISDIGKVLMDILSPVPKVLGRKDLVELLFRGQFKPGSDALRALRSGDEYKFIAGLPGEDGSPPSVNWSAAGLVAEGEPIALTGLPAGTVAWEGMPNVLWAVNRERGFAAFFGTQLVPFGDEAVRELVVAFMRGVWSAEF